MSTLIVTDIKQNSGAGTTLVLSSNTNVGVGNNTPADRLSVSGSAYVGGNLTVTESLLVSGSTINSTSFPGNANSATYLGNTSGTIANIASWVSGNAATAYTNAVANAAALYQTTAGLSANVATLAANSATYLGNSSGTVSNIAFWVTGNAATAYSNSVTYVDNKSFVNTSQLSSNLANYAPLSGGVITGTQTFSANTTVNAVLDIKTYLDSVSAPVISSSTLTLDLANSTVFNVSLNSNITTFNINNVPSNSNRSVGFTLIFTADGSARAVTWPGTVRWAGNTAPTLTSTLNKRDVFTFFTVDGGTSFNAFISGQNI